MGVVAYNGPVRVVLSLVPSFSIAFLLVSLAEHRLLPAAFGGALLEIRGGSGGMSIVGAVWFTFQLSWIIPMAVRIHRDGMGQAIDAFRLAGLIGVTSAFRCRAWRWWYYFCSARHPEPVLLGGCLLNGPCTSARGILRASPKSAAPSPPTSGHSFHHPHSAIGTSGRSTRRDPGMDARRCRARRSRNRNRGYDPWSPPRRLRSWEQRNAKEGKVRFDLASRCLKS